MNCTIPPVRRIKSFILNDRIIEITKIELPLQRKEVLAKLLLHLLCIVGLSIIS